jgi:hypothetical protein
VKSEKNKENKERRENPLFIPGTENFALLIIAQPRNYFSLFPQRPA